MLRRRMGGECEAVSGVTGDDDSMSVRERCTRLGSARGPPGTEGALVICTGRGFGADGDGDGDGLMSRAGWTGGLRLSFLVLEFLPRAEKKPVVTLDPAERDEACDVCDPNIVVECVTPARAG